MGTPVNAFNQEALLLAQLLQAAKGGPLVHVDMNNFVSVGQEVLACGYNDTMEAISTVLNDSDIFSIRPYSSKFKGIEISEQEYGFAVRKFTVIDRDPEENTEYGIEDNTSVDMQKVHKTPVLQLVFAGGTTYERSLTIWKHQLDTAFTPGNLMKFWSMIIQNLTDMREQDFETEKRAGVVNMIAGRIATANVDTQAEESVVYLVDEYNKFFGTKLTDAEAKTPANWDAVSKFALGYVNTVKEQVTERTNRYHTNISGKTVTRHTPYKDQRLYMLSTIYNPIKSNVLSDIFGPDYLKIADTEMVNFWMSPEAPAKIDASPEYLDPTTGKNKVGVEPVVVDNVFAVLFDREAIKAAVINQWSAMAPFNAKGGYSNRFDHYTCKWINDFTENCVVFVMGTKAGAAPQMLKAAKAK